MSPDAMHEALMRVSMGLAAGAVRPLPIVAHGVGSVVSALRQMSQARHVGKVVVQLAPPLEDKGLDGTFFVTGGVGEHCCSLVYL
jgi:hypothetical protein